MLYGTVKFEVTQLEDTAKVVWAHEYVLVTGQSEGDSVVTGTI